MEVEVSKENLAKYYHMALLFNGYFFSIVTYNIYNDWISTSIYSGASTVAVFLLIFKNRINNHFLHSNGIIFLTYVVFFSMSYLTGGTLSVSVWLFGLLPLMASAIISSKAAYCWGAVSMLTVSIIRVLDEMQVNSSPLDAGEMKEMDFYFNQMGLVFIISVFGIVTENLRKKHLKEKIAIEEKAFFNKNLVSLGEMGAGIAHEINNPLAVINGKVKQLLRSFSQNKEISQKDLENIAKIQEMSARIQNTIESLKFFSREGDEGKEGKFPLFQAIEEAVRMTKNRVIDYDINLSIEASEKDLNTEIKGTQIQLSMVLINLIDNSIDALIERQDERNVKVKVQRLEDLLLIRVIDNGAGVPSQLVHQIFTPFFTTKEVGEGTGLGLSYCRQLLKKMNGEITYLMDYHQHTCFQIILNMNKRLKNESI